MSAGSRLTITVRRARAAAELQAAQQLRLRVFCEEQGVSQELEVDGRDGEATHIVAMDESGVIATCRLRGVESGAWKLERMAVDARLRDLGVGSRLLSVAEDEARKSGAREIALNSQLSAEPFYASHRYERVGETFFEAGIEHVTMRKAL